MDDIQSWWEVPSIAHFCSLFRAAFNLLDFDIEELEEALLTDGTEDTGSSLLQELIVRLLCGCYGRNHGISIFNYQMFLRRLFRTKCREYGQENPFDSDIDFQFLPLRTKVEILQALCDFRLDADDVLDCLKNLESDSLRLQPLGYDRNKSAYWYFYGTRLYREDYPKVKKKESVPKRGRKRIRPLDTQEDEGDSEVDLGAGVWQVVCYTEEDWEKLAIGTENAPCKEEKTLHHVLTEDFLPEIPRLFEEKRHLQRKRLMEMAPRRQSTRIEKLKFFKEEEERKVQRKLEEREKNQKDDEKQMDEEWRKHKTNRERQKRLDNRSVRSNSEDRWTTEDTSSMCSYQTSTGDIASTGRRTNNSLSSAMEQILLQPPITKKIAPSEIFRPTEEDFRIGMYKIIKRLKNHEDAWPFCEPVEEDIAPNYYKKIKYPMDLTRMEEKLDEGRYTNLTEFKTDFYLIVDNCKVYNGPDNEYTDMVRRLQRVFNEAVSRYLDFEKSSDSDDNTEEIRIEYQEEKPKSKRGRKKKIVPVSPRSLTPTDDEDDKENENKTSTPFDSIASKYVKSPAFHSTNSESEREETESAKSHSNEPTKPPKRRRGRPSKDRSINPNIKSNTAAIEALELVTEQTLKDINKWLDDTPRYSEFTASPCNSPSHVIGVVEDYEARARIDAEYQKTLSKIDKMDKAARKEKKRQLKEQQRAQAAAEAAAAAALTTTTSVESPKQPQPASPIPTAVVAPIVTAPAPTPPVQLPPPAPPVKKKREMISTIDRLQPGKSKGNLLSNKSSTDDTNHHLGGNSQSGSKMSKDKDLFDELDKEDIPVAPQLSLGKVLTSDVISFGIGPKQHSFSDEEDDSNIELKDTIKERLNQLKDNNSKDSIKTDIDMSEKDNNDVDQTKEESIKEENEVKKEDDKEKNADLKKIEDEEIKVVDSPVSVSSPISNKKPEGEKSSKEVKPNFNAWFKAFGAPKAPVPIKRKSDFGSFGNPSTPLSSSEFRDSPDPRTCNSEDMDEISDLPPPTPGRSLGLDDGMGRSHSPDTRTKRQRRLSNGSSQSERSSFSQDPNDPLNSPRPSLDEPYVSPQQHEMKPYHHSPSSGPIKVGFYQDTFPRAGSDKSSSCSPRDQVPSNNNSPHLQIASPLPSPKEHPYYSNPMSPYHGVYDIPPPTPSYPSQSSYFDNKQMSEPYRNPYSMTGPLSPLPRPMSPGSHPMSPRPRSPLMSPMNRPRSPLQHRPMSMSPMSSLQHPMHPLNRPRSPDHPPMSPMQHSISRPRSPLQHPPPLMSPMQHAMSHLNRPRSPLHHTLIPQMNRPVHSPRPMSPVEKPSTPIYPVKKRIYNEITEQQKQEKFMMENQQQMSQHQQQLNQMMDHGRLPLHPQHQRLMEHYADPRFYPSNPHSLAALHAPYSSESPLGYTNKLKANELPYAHSKELSNKPNEFDQNSNSNTPLNYSNVPNSSNTPISFANRPISSSGTSSFIPSNHNINETNQTGNQSSSPGQLEMSTKSTNQFDNLTKAQQYEAMLKSSGNQSGSSQYDRFMSQMSSSVGYNTSSQANNPVTSSQLTFTSNQTNVDLLSNKLQQYQQSIYNYQDMIQNKYKQTPTPPGAPPPGGTPSNYPLNFNRSVSPKVFNAPPNNNSRSTPQIFNSPNNELPNYHSKLNEDSKNTKTKPAKKPTTSRKKKNQTPIIESQSQQNVSLTPPVVPSPVRSSTPLSSGTNTAFQQYMSQNNMSNSDNNGGNTKPTGMIPNTNMVPNNNFNFGTANNIKDSYSYLEDMRNSGYFLSESTTPKNAPNSPFFIPGASSRGVPGVPQSQSPTPNYSSLAQFMNPANSPVASNHPLYQQLLQSRSEQLLRPMMLSYPPGYLNMPPPPPHDRPPWL